MQRTDLDSDTGRTEWWTPPEVFEALGLVFDLDPAAPTGGVPWVPTKDHYSLEENGDGLSLPWRGTVWLNPPYSGQTKNWIAKMIEHGDGVALVNAHVETRWLHGAMAAASTVGFVRGRIAFVRPDGTRPGTASVNSVFLAYGRRAGRALEASGLCTCLRPTGPVASIRLSKPRLASVVL
jgi:hypothetical protein